jgi:hypothetical protein
MSFNDVLRAERRRRLTAQTPSLSPSQRQSREERAQREQEEREAEEAEAQRQREAGSRALRQGQQTAGRSRPWGAP